MEHVKSKVIVYQSDNYKLFKPIDGNRDTNKNKIARIIKEIESGNDILDESPVLVKEAKNYLIVLDGQNRIQVAERLGRPVHYIIKGNDMSIYNVAKVNSNVEKWTARNFINAYTKAGNENYKKLGTFHKTYGFAVGSCLQLLTHGTQKHDGGSEELQLAFQQGTFEVKKYKEAVQFAEICKGFSVFSGWNGRGFIIAIQKILQADLCDFSVLMKKFNSDPSKLTTQPNWKLYINNLEVIYNIGNSKRRTIV